MFKISPKTVLLLGILLLLGFLGNYYALPLFFGADFLFGSAFVLLILYLFGLRFSLIAAVLVNSYTYVLWGHPYGFIIFTLEILFVGFFLRDRRRNLLLLDGLYWLLVGVPLNALIYYVVLHMDITTTAFIILKQGVNGIFNALLVSLAINYIPFHRFLGRSQERRTVSIQETTFNLLVALVLIPALFLTIIQIRGEMKRIENSAVADLQTLSEHIQAHLVSWYRQNLTLITELAQHAGKSALSSPENLQHDTEILSKSFPDFHTLHVENAAGITIACSPTVNERGATIGVSLADREWFKEVRTGLRPVLSDVFFGKKLTMTPTTILSVPVLIGGRFGGAATASLDLRQLSRFLEPYSKENDGTITLTDSGDRVIASTLADRAPLQIWDRKKNGIVSPIIASVYRWSPDEKNLPSMTRWRKSYFVQESRIAPDIPWNLIIESPIAPLQKRLYGIYVQNLSVLAALVILTLLMALVLSRWLAKPLANLAILTSSLPEKITMQQVIDWPESATTEVDSLIGNFQSMTQALERSFQDINDHANALNMTLNATADGILAVAADGKIIFYNQQFARLWEIPQDILDTGDDSILLAHVLEQLSDPDNFKKEVLRLYNSVENSFDVIPFKDGRVVERYSFPLKHGESLLNGRVWSFRNITERKQQESVLRKSEYEFRMLAEAMPQIVWVCSPDGTSIYLNQQWVDYTGLTLEESSEHGWNKPFHPDDQRMNLEAWHNATRNGRDYAFECRLRRADGVYKWWLVRGVPVLDENGAIIKWFGTCTDIDELKKAEEEKLFIEQQLQQTQRLESLGVLAGGIAHDFNNLLANIIGNCYLAKMNPENVTENLDTIEKASESAAALCRQMLEYAGHTQVAKSRIDTKMLVNDMVEMLAATGPKNVTIKPAIPPNISYVHGDASQIRQIVMNLMINATEAIGEAQGEIDVTLTNSTITAEQPEKDHLGRIIPAGMYVCLEVTDNGCGMDYETKRRLFEPFFTTKFTGRGLGLSATLGIITGHDGALQLFSQPGKGTTFRVYLPATGEDTGCEGSLDHVTTSVPWQGSGTILLVEDDDQVRFIAKTILIKFGFTVVEAINGKEALEKYQEDSAHISLVLTDIGMPLMDGYELFFELKKLNPGLPIIISSGFGDRAITSRIPEEDMAGLISKPYNPLKLRELLKSILEGRRAKQA